MEKKGGAERTGVKFLAFSRTAAQGGGKDEHKASDPEETLHILCRKGWTTSLLASKLGIQEIWLACSMQAWFLVWADHALAKRYVSPFPLSEANGLLCSLSYVGCLLVGPLAHLMVLAWMSTALKQGLGGSRWETQESYSVKWPSSTHAWGNWGNDSSCFSVDNRRKEARYSNGI